MALLHCRKASYHDYRLGPSLNMMLQSCGLSKLLKNRHSKIYPYFIDNKKSSSVFLTSDQQFVT